MFGRGAVAALALTLSLAVSLSAALSLAVAGCGGSDGGGDSAAPTATVRRSPTTTAAPATTTTVAPGQEDFTAILGDLLARRDEAYEKNDVSILEQIYSTQCACLANGRKVIEQRKAEGVHTSGERLNLIRAEVASRVSSDLVFIRGVVSQGPNNLLDAQGNVVRAGETHGPVAVIYETSRVNGQWIVLGITEEGPVES